MMHILTIIFLLLGAAVALLMAVCAGYLYWTDAKADRELEREWIKAETGDGT